MGQLKFLKKKKVDNFESLILGSTLDDKWKILISDDDEDIHIFTKTVLKNFTYKNKSIEFISTYNGQDTINMVKTIMILF